MDAKKIPSSIFLDLCKAFDTLDHNVLLSKLEYFGIRDTALNWLKTATIYRLQLEKQKQACLKFLSWVHFYS